MSAKSRSHDPWKREEWWCGVEVPTWERIRVDRLGIAAWSVLNLTQDIKSMSLAPPHSLWPPFPLSPLAGEDPPLAREDREDETPLPMFPPHYS